MITIPNRLRSVGRRLQFPATPAHPATPVTGRALVGASTRPQLNSVELWRRQHGLPRATR